MFKVLKYRRDIMSNSKVQHEYQHDTCTSIIEAPNTLKGLLPVVDAANHRACVHALKSLYV